eukprot:3038396-Pleurochrysis_carterae.AAC.2
MDRARTSPFELVRRRQGRHCHRGSRANPGLKVASVTMGYVADNTNESSNALIPGNLCRSRTLDSSFEVKPLDPARVRFKGSA